MASSKAKPNWIYDVFINFRGEDTRQNFVSHLYSALSIAGINTFLDDEELDRGEELGAELLRAIKGSQIAIVVFSEKYVESSWCLEELVTIMESHSVSGQVVFPVFYHVTPSYIRYLTETDGEALYANKAKDALLSKKDKLENRTKDPFVGMWKKALRDAKALAGWDVRHYSNESNIVKEIVSEVLKRVDKTYLSITNFPVGLTSRVHHVIKFLQKPNRGVCMVGIWGMGGIGKTTIAKVIFNEIRKEFEGKSFLANIREVWEKDRGQIDLQEQLIYDILKTKKMKVHSIELGQALIEEALQSKRALVLLDDVDKFEQLNALCGNRKWFHPGSVIIITTRDVRLLSVLEVDYVYGVEGMNEGEALELFSWHAFKEATPTKNFLSYSKDVVAYCGGLPLALEVLGSYLYKREKLEWQSVLSKLEKIPNDEIQKKLRISFDGLTDHMEKDIFLDICCFFIGKDRTYVIEILNGCGLHADIGLTVLIERSLIKVEKNDKLGVHDLLRDMGREIVRQDSPKKPEKRSRLWLQDDVIDVLTEHTGTRAIEGLAMKMQRTSGFCVNAKAFKKMMRLRLLQLNYVKLVGEYEYLPKHLRWLYWRGFPLQYIPDNFPLGNAAAIDLKYSNLQIVWKEPQLMERLKILNLSHSWYLRSTPDFSKLPNLEKLILKDCPSLFEIHQSIGSLTNLVLINLKDCRSLTSLPRTIYNLKCLKALILSGCSKIDMLEEDIVRMESLTTLIADNTSVKQVPFSIVRSKNIEYLSLCGYEGLARDVLPSIIWSWMSPSTNLVSCIQPFGSMSTSLISMNIQDENLCELFPVLGGLANLRSISVQFESEFHLAKEFRRILDDLCDINLTELKRTSHASQIPEKATGAHLIGMGSYHQVINRLSKNISEGLAANGSGDFSLPSHNHPYWLAYTGQGNSVHFRVPEDRDHLMKGMILCVVYSSTSVSMAIECLKGVLIVNYTKCTVQIYRRDTTMSFNDVDWQAIISNLGPGDNVEIFVAFGHGLTVRNTTAYLIYNQSITVELESPINIKTSLQPSPIVTIEFPCNMKKNLSPTVAIELPCKMETDPHPNVTIEIPGNTKTNPSPNVTIDSSSNMKMELSSDVKLDLSSDVKLDPVPNVNLDRSPEPKKSIYSRLTKTMRACLCLNRDFHNF